MKTILALSLLLTASFAHADMTLKGLAQSNAGFLTESLIEKAKDDSSISVDTTFYTIVLVKKVDEERGNSIECRRDWFGGTPPQYVCLIRDLTTK